jgi:hypothetical protein
VAAVLNGAALFFELRCLEIELEGAVGDPIGHQACGPYPAVPGFVPDSDRRTRAAVGGVSNAITRNLEKKFVASVPPTKTG